MTTNSDSEPLKLRQRPWFRTLRSFVIAYLTVCVLIAFLQRTLMYQPTRADKLPAAEVKTRRSVTDVEIQTEDGLTLNGWHWTARGSDEVRPVVLFFHGNGGHRGGRAFQCEYMVGAGVDVIIFDYRGYADNDGKPSEKGLAKDARAAWKFATETIEISPDRIILYGASLGGGVAVSLASELCQSGTPPGGLILQSTFSSMVDAAQCHYPWLPVRLVLLDRYPSLAKIGNVTCPILQFHGTTDRIVPFELGRRLFDAAPEESTTGIDREFVTIENAGHNDLVMIAADEICTGIRRMAGRL